MAAGEAAGLIELVNERFEELKQLDIWSMSETFRKIGDRQERELSK